MDNSTGLPVAGATAEVTISGPETLVLSTGQSDSSGYAIVTWQTQKPKGKGGGGTSPGSYTASVTNLIADGYTWDGVVVSAGFTIQ